MRFDQPELLVCKQDGDFDTLGASQVFSEQLSHFVQRVVGAHDRERDRAKVNQAAAQACPER
jgi:hypothetical protein